MSLEASRRVWESSNAKLGARLVLLAIADHSNKDGLAWPSAGRIACETLLSLRQVRRCLSELERAGELVIERGAGPNRTHVYRIVVGLTPSVGGDRMSGCQDVTVTSATDGGDISDMGGDISDIEGCHPVTQTVRTASEPYLIRSGSQNANEEDAEGAASGNGGSSGVEPSGSASGAGGADSIAGELVARVQAVLGRTLSNSEAAELREFAAREPTFAMGAVGAALSYGYEYGSLGQLLEVADWHVEQSRLMEREGSSNTRRGFVECSSSRQGEAG